MAEKGIAVRIVSEEEAAKIGRGGLVPAFRIRDSHRRFFGWAERNNDLRGVTEIYFERDGVGVETTVIVRLESDA
jgi:hypothetical protein